MDWKNCILPEELILHEIVPKLPTKSVIRFKSLSKSWLFLISQHTSLIAAKHTAGEKPGSIISGRYKTDKNTTTRLFFRGNNESNLFEIDNSYIYENPDRVTLVGSSNGIVCLKIVYSDETHDLVLWNPVTREVNYLLTREVYTKLYTKYAIGYDERSGVDKVVQLMLPLKDFFKEDGVLLKAQIFYKKSGGWRNLKSSTEICASFVIVVEEGEGLTVDGVIYWRRNPFDVLSFDLSKEEFRQFEGPLSDHPFWDFLDYELIEWKGFLGVVYVERGGEEIQVWLKNKDNNNSDSAWTKISTIQPSLGPIYLGGKVFRGQIIVRLLVPYL